MLLITTSESALTYIDKLCEGLIITMKDNKLFKLVYKTMNYI